MHLKTTMIAFSSKNIGEGKHKVSVDGEELEGYFTQEEVGELYARLWEEELNGKKDET